MPVRINRPPVNIREKLSELERPIGLNGSALMRTETPQEAFSLIGAGRKNLLINGDFKVSQRGDYSSATSASHSTYYLDRWKTDISGPTATIQRQTVTLPDGTQTYSAKLAATSTVSSGYLQLQQFIEVFPYMQGRTVTFSAWVRSNRRVRLRMENSVTNYDSLTSHSGNGNWEYITQTFTLGTGLATLRFGVILWNSNGALTGTSTGSNITSGDYLEFADYQVEFGKVATPFEYRSITEELAMCQRYFYKYGGTSEGYSSNGAVFPLHKSSNNVYFISGVHPVQMRGTPTLTTSLSSGTYAADLYPDSSQEWSFRDWYVDTRASGSIDIAPEYYGRNWTLKLGTTLSNVNASVIFWYGSSTAFIYFNAEL